MSTDPVREYALSVVKRRIASLCLALGWNSTHSSAMDVSSFSNHSDINSHNLILATTLKYEI